MHSLARATSSENTRPVSGKIHQRHRSFCFKCRELREKDCLCVCNSVVAPVGSARLGSPTVVSAHRSRFVPLQRSGRREPVAGSAVGGTPPRSSSERSSRVQGNAQNRKELVKPQLLLCVALCVALCNTSTVSALAFFFFFFFFFHSLWSPSSSAPFQHHS